MPDGKDQLLNAFLEEVVGGQTPPDASERILNALAATNGAPSGASRDASASPSYTPPAGSGQAAGGGLITPHIATSAEAGRGVTSMAIRRSRRRSTAVTWLSLASAVAVVLAVSIIVVLSTGDAPPVNVPLADGSRVGDGPRQAPPSDLATGDQPLADTTPGDTDPTGVVPAPEVIRIDPSGRGPVLVGDERDSDAGAPVRVADSSLRSASDAEVIALVNRHIAERWDAERIKPSPAAADAEWCRRVYLDLLGRIPSLDELQQFVRARGSDKRAELVDRLLESDDYVEEYARNWTSIWTNILLGRSGGTDRNSLVNRDGMQQYLRRSFQRNKPYDEMVYELVSAEGVNKPGEQGYNGAVNFMLDNLQEDATTATAKTARYFLGMQVQCTQCHDHPFSSDIKQNQFWEMNAFFRQAKALRTRSGRDITQVELIDEDFAGERGSSPEEAEIYFEQRNGILQAAYPVFVDGRAIDPKGWVSDVNRRDELARLIVSSEYLGRAIVNRMWAHFLGHGFTRPIDDMRPDNPPSHPELLEELSQQFVASGHDLKRLMRWITLSEPYSLSSKFGDRYRNAKDDPALGGPPLFSHFYLRQMRAEELYESLLVATAAEQSRGAYQEQEELKSQWLAQFTIAFGTDEGDEMTTFNGSIPQTLMMMNGDLISKATDVESNGFLRSVVSSGRSDAQNISSLYLAALGRPPTKPELDLANDLLAARDGNSAEALEDVWWAVLNSNEFILNH